MNTREQLAAVAEWLGWQHESLSLGLRNSMDALRLYDYARAHPNLPAMADQWDARRRIAAVGYDPLAQREVSTGRAVSDTGAGLSVLAMRKARQLLGSVAYVAKEGDKESVIALLDRALYSE